MSETPDKKECSEETRKSEDNLKILETFENEVKFLSAEKDNLLNIEESLWLKINEEIENKRKLRDELRQQVEELRIRCERLAKLLNSLIQTQYTT
ncbi:MAG: hypothetical protein QXJ53_04110 [Candidatus Bathyarchaeia archaeon]